MTVHRLILPSIVLLSAASIAAYAASPSTATTDVNPPAAGHEWHRGHRHGGTYGGLLHQLNLLDDQKTKIKAIFVQARPQFEALRTAQRSARDQLASTLPTDSAYPALLASVQSAAQAQVSLKAQTWGLVLQELTKEQISQIPGIIAAREQAWAARKTEWQAKHPASPAT
jgi:Spy/CpxP family protein refolding chaperone